MANKKGTGRDNLISMDMRTPEERHRIAMMGVEKRKKNKEQKMALQKTMRTLLGMRVMGDKQRKLLYDLGFEGEELTNRMLLMTVLFKKGLSGNVEAIKEITDMMEKLDMVEEGKKLSNQTVTINLVSNGESYHQTEEDEQDIWKAENGIPFDVEDDTDDWNMDEQDDEEDWGNDVYDG